MSVATTLAVRSTCCVRYVAHIMVTMAVQRESCMCCDFGSLREQSASPTRAARREERRGEGLQAQWLKLRYETTWGPRDPRDP